MSVKTSEYETFTITLDDGTVETYSICTVEYFDDEPAEVVVEPQDDEKEKEVKGTVQEATQTE